MTAYFVDDYFRRSVFLYLEIHPQVAYIAAISVCIAQLIAKNDIHVVPTLVQTRETRNLFILKFIIVGSSIVSRGISSSPFFYLSRFRENSAIHSHTPLSTIERVKLLCLFLLSKSLYANTEDNLYIGFIIRL